MGKRLAIKGHPTRGKEVIELLEMMGGESINVTGRDITGVYFISTEGTIETHFTYYKRPDNYAVFTLEEFLDKYPFKVGDKVLIPEYELEVRICKMEWDGFEIQYKVYRNDDEEWYNAEELLKYNDDFYNMETKAETTGFMQVGKTFAVIFNDSNYEDEVELQLGDYEIEVRNGKTYAVKKKSKYPTTYEECCQHLGYDDKISNKKLVLLSQLINASNAYWKIAGEQMGLDGHWEPDWTNEEQKKYCICYGNGNIQKVVWRIYSSILAFPTEEMRDVFYENFKDLIEQCKELL